MAYLYELNKHKHSNKHTLMLNTFIPKLPEVWLVRWRSRGGGGPIGRVILFVLYFWKLRNYFNMFSNFFCLLVCCTYIFLF